MHTIRTPLIFQLRHLRWVPVLGVLSALFVENVLGDIYVTVSESKGSTTLRWRGSLDVSGLEPVGTSPAPEGAIFPRLGVVSGSGHSDLDVYLFRNLQLRSFGKGKAALSTSTKGDPFLISNTLECNELCLCLPAGYQGSAIYGELTFNGVTLKDLQIDTTPFVYDLGGQSVHFFSDPEPKAATGPSRGLVRNQLIQRSEARVRPHQKLRLQLGPIFPGGGRPDAEVPSVAVRPVISAR